MCVIGNYNVNVCIEVCIYASIKAKFMYSIQTKQKKSYKMMLCLPV